MAPENIIVKGFMFCLAHGHEYCHACCCDHRMTNNIQIEDELGDMTEFFEFEVEDRHPINVYALGAVRLGDAEPFACVTHLIADCTKCFDWVAIVKKEAEAAEEEGRWLTRRSRLIERMEA